MIANLEDVLRVSIAHEGQLVETDPNGFAVMALIPDVIETLLRPDDTLTSDVSGGSGCVVYTDYDGSVVLTPAELMRLAGLRLTKPEYFALIRKYGMRHQWHEDFYDPDTGEALQPRNPMELPS